MTSSPPHVLALPTRLSERDPWQLVTNLNAINPNEDSDHCRSRNRATYGLHSFDIHNKYALLAFYRVLPLHTKGNWLVNQEREGPR